MLHLTPLWQGVTLGLAMIAPIGAQNAFVINQGIRRRHHLMVAAICTLCDLMLISLGVFGTGALISQQPLLLMLVTAAGILFLTVYGALALRSAWRIGPHDAPAQTGIPGGRGPVLLATLAVTLLNPHVYLDTMVILGAIGNQMSQDQRPWFAIGCLIASLIWFNTLSLGAARLGPLLSQPRVRQIIDLLIGLTMLALAARLATQL